MDIPIKIAVRTPLSLLTQLFVSPTVTELRQYVTDHCELYE